MINTNFMPESANLRSTAHGKGKTIAENFQQAVQSASGVGSEARGDIAEIGLQSVLQQPQASAAEKIVAQSVLQQAAEVESRLTRGFHGDSRQGSRYAMLSQGLGYVAAGGCANGPIGVVLADLGNRQMDKTRSQSFHSASPAEVRDSNVVGASMLKQIAQNVDDPAIQFLASQTLDELGDRYNKSKWAHRIGGEMSVLQDDSCKLHQAFDEIKVMAALGEPDNPKLLALMEGKLPEGSLGSYSVGRPDGGYAEYPSPEFGFGVTRAARPFDH